MMVCFGFSWKSFQFMLYSIWVPVWEEKKTKKKNVGLHERPPNSCFFVNLSFLLKSDVNIHDLLAWLQRPNSPVFVPLPVNQVSGCFGQTSWPSILSGVWEGIVFFFHMAFSASYLFIFFHLPVYPSRPSFFFMAFKWFSSAFLEKTNLLHLLCYLVFIY